MGNWILVESEVASLVRQGFLNLFSSGLISVPRNVWLPLSWPNCLTLEEVNLMDREVSSEEIKEALWTLKPFKAPRPDELLVGFFQNAWAIVGDSVVNEVKNIFRTRTMPLKLNQTLIMLIPKCDGPESLSNFRPISLGNTLYKVLTKVIVNMIRPMSKLVSPLQSTFVPSRRGLDNVIIAQEIIHTLTLKKGNTGFMAVKIDLKKAYDRLEQNFIKDVLLLYNLPSSMVDLIMRCESSFSTSLLFNGGMLEPFLPSRSIRQGDPMSPYIFIFCMEVQGYFVDDKCRFKLWDPIKASRGGPAMSHLFFADDLILLAKTTFPSLHFHVIPILVPIFYFHRF